MGSSTSIGVTVSLAAKPFGFGAEERILKLAEETEARNVARAAQVAPLVAHMIKMQAKVNVIFVL